MREIVDLMLNAGVVLLTKECEPAANKRARGRGTIDPSSEVVRVYLTSFLGGVQPSPVTHFTAKKQVLDWVTSAIQHNDNLHYAARTVGDVRRVIKLADTVYYSCEHLFEVNYVCAKDAGTAMSAAAAAAVSLDSLSAAAHAHYTLKLGFDKLAVQVAKRLSRLIAERVAVPSDLEAIAGDIKFVAHSYLSRSNKNSAAPLLDVEAGHLDAASPKGNFSPRPPALKADNSVERRQEQLQPDLSIYRNDFEVLAFDGFKEVFSSTSFHRALGSPEEMIRFAQSMVPFAAEYMHPSSGVPLMELAMSCFFTDAMSCTANRIAPERLRCLTLDGSPEVAELYCMCRTFGAEGLNHFFSSFSVAASMILEQSSAAVDVAYLAAVDLLLNNIVPKSQRSIAELQKCVSADLARRGPTTCQELVLLAHRCLSSPATAVRNVESANFPRSLDTLMRWGYGTFCSEAKRQFVEDSCRCFVKRCVAANRRLPKDPRMAARAEIRQSPPPLPFHFGQEQTLVAILSSLAGVRDTFSHTKLLQDMELCAQVTANFNESVTSNPESMGLPRLEKTTILATNNAFEHLRGYRLSTTTPRCLAPACKELCQIYASLVKPARKFLWVLSKMMLTVNLCMEKGRGDWSHKHSFPLDVVLSSIHFVVLNSLVAGTNDELSELGISDVIFKRCVEHLTTCGLVDSRRLVVPAWYSAQASEHPTTLLVPALDEKPSPSNSAAADVSTKKQREKDAIKLDAQLVRFFKHHGVHPRDPVQVRAVLSLAGVQMSPSVVDVRQAIERLVQRGFVEPVSSDPTLLKYAP